jgi:hypothetical protein
MARKLKTYQMSMGFFERAIAAPSMKAALEAWGADSNLFHQGAAKESHDPGEVGVVLKRPVGSQRAVQGACRTAQGYRRRRRSEEGRAKSSEPQATKAYEDLEDLRCGGSQGRARVREGESASAQRRRRLSEKSASGGRRLSIGLKPPWIPPAGSMTRTLPTFKPSWKLSKNGRRPKKRDGKRNDPNWKRCSGGPAGRRPAVEMRQISSCSSLIGSFRSR